MRLCRLLIALSLLTVGLLIGGRAEAQADFVGVRALGMGEAQRADATGAEAPLLNPAGMSLVRQYAIEAMYGLRIEQLGHNAAISIVDSITARVAAGLFYNYVHESPRATLDWAGGTLYSVTMTRTGHVAGLALSLPLGQYFILGASAKYLHLDTTVPLPPGTVPATLSLESINSVTFDVGLLFRFGERFHLGVVGYNLWNHGTEAPLSLGFGLAFRPIPSLTINFDDVINFTGYENASFDRETGQPQLSSRITTRLGPGLEFIAGQKVPLRAGVVYDTGLSATFLSFGLGYLSPSFGIDLSYRTKVKGGVENFLMLGLRLFVN